MIIAVDFDGVIHDQMPLPGKRMGRPIEGVIPVFEVWYAKGYEVIIHTVRANTPHGAASVVAWLEYFGIPFSSVWTKAGKPNADLYLDDKAIRFTSWADVMEQLDGRS